MDPRDQLFLDNTFSKIILGIKIVWRFILNCIKGCKSVSFQYKFNLFSSVLYHRGHIQSFEFAFVREMLVLWIHSRIKCALEEIFAGNDINISERRQNLWKFRFILWDYPFVLCWQEISNLQFQTFWELYVSDTKSFGGSSPGLVRERNVQLH